MPSGEYFATHERSLATLSHSDNSRVDSFLAKVRIQANWPSQTASLPARPPMQGAGYGPRHTAIENTVLAVEDNAVTCYRQSLYNASRPARHPATMTGHRQPEFAIGKVLVRLKVYSVDVGVQQGILCRSTELSTLFCGKTAILRQSRKRTRILEVVQHGEQ